MRDGGFWLRTRWTLLTWLCGAALLTPSQVRAEDVARVDLIGSWFVLIHYRDSATANPDSDRWEDRVWTFEMKGSRLHWTDHPIVVFDDGSGRFEARGGNRRARVLAAWQPNEAQRQEIQAGLRVNSRGTKTKSLRGSFESGWESVGTLRAQSASVVGYHETWRIANLTTLPVFTRDDVLGSGPSDSASARIEGLEGRTQYTTREVLEGGNLLRGDYARDQNRTGTFQLIRSGSARGLDTGGLTPNQKAAERARRQLLEDVNRPRREDEPEPQE